MFPSERAGGSAPPTPTRARSRCWRASTSTASPRRWTTTCSRPTSSSSSSDPPEEAAADGAPELVPLGPPGADEGPHLAYAVQWFIFTTIAAGGYVLLLRRVARDQAGEEAGRARRDLDRGRWPRRSQR